MVNLHVSKRANGLIESPIRKFLPLVRAAEKSGVEVIKLNVGDPDIFAPEEILKTIRGYKNKNIHYAPSSGIEEHVQAWQKYYANFGLKLKSENIIPTMGAAEAIFMALMAVSNPGDEIIVFEPLYTSYKGFAALCNIKLIPVRLKLEDDFVLADERVVLKKINKKTKAIVIINPDNPTGKVWNRKELDMVVRVAKKHNLFIIADETYREIVFKGRAGSLLNYIQVRQNIIVVDSLSKRFCIPGIRIGALVSYNKEIMRLVLKMAMVRLSVPTLGQQCTIPLLENPKKYTQKVKKEFQKRCKVVNQMLAKIPGVVSFKPAGAFYQVAGLPVENSEDFIKFLLTKFRYKNRTVLFAPMQDFYVTPGLGKNEIRIAYVLNSGRLKLAMIILRKGLEEFLK